LETDLEAKLNDFVQKGGILVGTFLTAYVNETNLCHLGGFPGKSMRQLFGIWNEGMDYLFPDESIKIKDVQLGSKYKLDGMSFTIIEQLNLEGAKVLSEADSDFHQGAPLITENKVKDGLAYYLGAEFDDAILENFYKCLKSKHHLEDAHEAIDLPEGVVLRKRCSNEGNFYFLFNYRNTKVQIDFGTLEWIDFSKNQKLFKETVLDPYETLILRKVC
jgi:beta-galactosidase